MSREERVKEARLGLMIFMQYGMEEYKKHVDNRPENKIRNLEKKVQDLEKKINQQK